MIGMCLLKCNICIFSAWECPNYRRHSALYDWEFHNNSQVMLKKSSNKEIKRQEAIWGVGWNVNFVVLLFPSLKYWECLNLSRNRRRLSSFIIHVGSHVGSRTPILSGGIFWGLMFCPLWQLDSRIYFEKNKTYPGR